MKAPLSPWPLAVLLLAATNMLAGSVLLGRLQVRTLAQQVSAQQVSHDIDQAALLMQQHKAGQVDQLLQAALKLDPTNPIIALDQSWNAVYHLDGTKERQTDATKAINLLNLPRNAVRDDRAKLLYVAYEYRGEADNDLDDPQYQQAIDDFTEAINWSTKLSAFQQVALKPFLSYAYGDRGALELWLSGSSAQGNVRDKYLGEALNDFNSAVSRYPIFSWYLGRAIVFDKISRTSQANQDFTQCVKVFPDCAGFIKEYRQGLRRNYVEGMSDTIFRSDGTMIPDTLSWPLWRRTQN